MLISLANIKSPLDHLIKIQNIENQTIRNIKT